MQNKLLLAPSISWQSYEIIDLAFILNRATHNFYYFRDTGRFIIECILETKDVEEVIKLCKSKYDVEEKFLLNTIDEFLCLLKQEGIIYE